MFFEEQDATELKAWLVSKLTNISDADSDVLADYVLALLRTDTEKARLKADVLANLEDFLKENTVNFVDEIFRVVQVKAYKPGYVPSRDNHQAVNSALGIGASSTSTLGSSGVEVDASKEFQRPRKRSYNETRENGHTDSHYLGNERQKRQIRGGRGGRGGFGARNGSSQAVSPSPMTGFSMPQMPQGMAFDPNDPMSAILAMQAMGLPPLPGMPGFPQVDASMNGSQSGSRKQSKIGACHDYNTKGYCLKGDACPFSHGGDPLIVPGGEEYDPKNASLMDTSPTSPTSNNSLSHTPRGHGRGRGRGRGDREGFQPRRNRAEFSQAGPNHNRSITTVVVEQIPEDKFNEQSVRDFFSEFGTISEIKMQAYKHLALVKYDSYTAAKAAYDSPKVIFDNRFVKVYWFNPDTVPKPRPSLKSAAPGQAGGSPSSRLGKPMEEEEAFDMEEFEQKSRAAQKRLEEKKAQMEAMAAKREALEKQKEALAAKQAAEKQRLLERLGAKGSSAANPETDDVNMSDTPSDLSTTKADGHPTVANTETTPSNPRTAALKAQLATLEAEARSLGLNASSPSSSQYSSPNWSSRGRGRGYRGGSYRGWEGFDPSYRGRGTSFRGGRGGLGAANGGKYNLDNRTKRIAVTLPNPTAGEDNSTEVPNAEGESWTGEKDEALRQWLLLVGGEFEDVSLASAAPATTNGAVVSTAAPAAMTAPSTDKTKQIITFKDRSTAEQFLFSGSKTRDVPGLGTVELNWWNDPVSTSAVLTPLPPSAAAAAATSSPSTSAPSAESAAGGTGGEKKHQAPTAPALTTSSSAAAGGSKSATKDQLDEGPPSSTAVAATATAGGAGTKQSTNNNTHHAADVDYDVAEEDDERWMDI